MKLLNKLRDYRSRKAGELDQAIDRAEAKLTSVWNRLFVGAILEVVKRATMLIFALSFAFFVLDGCNDTGWDKSQDRRLDRLERQLQDIYDSIHREDEDDG